MKGLGRGFAAGLLNMIGITSKDSGSLVGTFAGKPHYKWDLQKSFAVAANLQQFPFCSVTCTPVPIRLLEMCRRHGFVSKFAN